MKQPVLATLIAALTLTPLAGLHAEMGEHKEHRKEMRAMHKDLNLTPEQETKMKALRDSQRDAMKPLREKHQALAKKLKELTDKKAPDTEIKATLAELDANKTAMHEQMKSFKDQRNAILTPTQQAQMETRKGEMMKKHMGEMGDMGDDKDEEHDHDDKK